MEGKEVFHGYEVEGKLNITLSNGIYVDSLNLKPVLQNKIRRMAALRNPVYYKNQALGTMNFDTPQWIYLGKDYLNGYIQIPRGLYEKLLENVKRAEIDYEVIDEREPGKRLNVSFKGELRDEQKPALEELVKHDNGILHAATAFGKTVVCSAVIAEKKVNTLILLESSALIDQWREALEKFLEIQEELPEYKTKTGRTKVRKSLIGKLQGAHDSMTGNNSKKEHRRIREQLQAVSPKETLILVATGSLVGEGFDFPRLDTLIMATPISFRSVVEQYAGRLNRDYEGKKNVIVYDYVDSHISMFDKMYAKRLKAYKQIGYEICSGLQNEKQKANAIFDSENYAAVYRKDLLEANKNIIISSPVISGQKVYELIDLMREKQISGVEMTIVTWAPDSYGYGDPAFWMRLHEDIRQAGFYIKTVEESCEHFAVIDQELVWYGSMNL